MQGKVCSVPMCDRAAVSLWDTLRKAPSEDSASPATLPVCELHAWVLSHGGRISLTYRG